jgi:glutathione S-transferase
MNQSEFSFNTRLLKETMTNLATSTSAPTVPASAASSLKKPAQAIKLHRFAISGHAHRVELFLSLLGLPFERVDVDLAGGAHKTPAFLAMNPFGQVPVIQDGAVTVSDSNAILVYLATRYAADPEQWFPREPVAAAAVQRWLSVAAGTLAFGPAAARVVQLFKRADDAAPMIARAHGLLAVMEMQLSQSPFLAGTAPTLADIANYTYVAHAPEGNVSLEPYPHVRAWLARIEALPGFVPMVRSQVGLAA